MSDLPPPLPSVEEPKPVRKTPNALSISIGIISFVVAYVAIHHASAYTKGRLFGAVVVGMLMGLIPYMIGKKHGKLGLAQVALICCILGGLLGGLVLALPLCILFVAIILVTRKKA